MRSVKRIAIVIIIITLCMITSESISAESKKLSFKIIGTAEGSYELCDTPSEGMAVVMRLIKGEAKYGYLNTTGKEVIPCKYDDAYPFSGGLAIIVKDGKYGIINKRGKEIVKPKYDSISSELLNGKLIPVSIFDEKSGTELWGYVDRNGKEIIKPKYDEISEIEFTKGLVCVGLDEKYSFINISGKEITPLIYDYIYDDDAGNTGKLHLVEKDRKYGYIDSDGNQVVPLKYDDALPFYEGLASVKTGYSESVTSGKWGVIDENGTEIIPPKYDMVFSYNNGVAIANIGGGSDTISTEYSSDGMTYIAISLFTGGKYLLIDRTGREIMLNNYDYVGMYCEGFAEVKANDKWGYIDSTGKEVVPTKYDSVDFFENGYAYVENDGKYGFIDTSGNEIVPIIYDKVCPFSEGFAAVCIGNRWGFVDELGQVVIPIQFYTIDNVYGDFEFKDGYAQYHYRFSIYYIDRSGNRIDPPANSTVFNPYFYDGLKSFSVNRGDILYYGYQDISGMIVIEPQFENASYFADGVATVYLNSKWKFIKCNRNSSDNRKKLSVPGNINAIINTGKEVKLTWNRTVNAKYYFIYRSMKKDGNYSYIGKTSDTSYIDNTVARGKTYYYKLVARYSFYNSDTDSNYSASVTIKLR